MATCTFCGNLIERGTGKIYVDKAGKIMYFCSMKCEKNLFKLSRIPRTTTWTKEYAKVKHGLKADPAASKAKKTTA